MSEYDDELRRMFEARDRRRAEENAKAKREAEEMSKADIIYLDESQYHTVTNLNIHQKTNYTQRNSRQARTSSTVRSRARYTAPKGTFQNKKKMLKPHNLLYALACAMSIGTLVYFMVPKHIDTSSLNSFIENTAAIEESGVPYDTLQALQDFADKYAQDYEKGNFTKAFLKKNYEQFREIANEVLKSKISQATGTPQEEITVTKPYPASEVTIGMRDTSYKGVETVVEARFNNPDEKLSPEILSVASPLYKSINICDSVDPFANYSKGRIKDEAGFLYGYIQDLVDFSQMEIIYNPQARGENGSLSAVKIDTSELTLNDINSIQSDDLEK